MVVGIEMETEGAIEEKIEELGEEVRKMKYHGTDGEGVMRQERVELGAVVAGAVLERGS